MSDTLTFEHTDGRLLSCYAGSAMEEVLRSDPDWSEVEQTEAAESTDPAKLGRDDLNAYAAERGVTEPEKLPNKDAVLAALVEVEQTEATPEGD